MWFNTVSYGLIGIVKDIPSGKRSQKTMENLGKLTIHGHFPWLCEITGEQVPFQPEAVFCATAMFLATVGLAVLVVIVVSTAKNSDGPDHNSCLPF